MRPVQYVILNKSVKMSTGKAAAQAAHASQLGLLSMVEFQHDRNPYDKSIVNRWMRGGHYAKIVLEADDLFAAERYITERGFDCALVIDEGRTEVSPLTPTAIGTGVVNKDDGHTQDTFSVFNLYKDEVTTEPPPEWRERYLRYIKEKGDAQ